MLCLKDVRGFARVSTKELIYCCKNQLKIIYSYRRSYRHKYMRKHLRSAMWWWSHLWRFLGFSKPKYKDILKLYKSGGIFSHEFEVDMIYGLQEMDCKSLLAMAKIHDLDKIYVSEIGLKNCNFGKW